MKRMLIIATRLQNDEQIPEAMRLKYKKLASVLNYINGDVETLENCCKDYLASEDEIEIQVGKELQEIIDERIMMNAIKPSDSPFECEGCGS